MLIEKEVITADDIEKLFGPKAGTHGEERLKGDRTNPAPQEGEKPETSDTDKKDGHEDNE